MGPNLTGPLDQVSGLCNEIANMTAGYHSRLEQLPDAVRDELVQYLGSRLIDTFIPDPCPPTRQEDP